MYRQRFGLTGRPFPATPDSALYYPATGHEAALARLERGLADDEGVLTLTGPPGVGKTLLCHCLLERLGAGAASAFLTNSHFPDRTALLQAVLFELSLPYEDGGEQVLRLRLTDFLLKNCAAGRRAVLLVDEAQYLAADHLEELRLLGNLEAGRGKAFQVILVGQEGLREALAGPGLAALNQRVAVRAALEPMPLEESVDYLLHQVRRVGGRPEALFEDPALEILARAARGLPRLLNQAAHQALCVADAAELDRVDAEAALEALALLGLDTEEGAPPPDGAEATLPVLGAGEGEADAAPAGEAASVCRLYASPRRPA